MIKASTLTRAETRTAAEPEPERARHRDAERALRAELQSTRGALLRKVGSLAADQVAAAERSARESIAAARSQCKHRAALFSTALHNHDVALPLKAWTPTPCRSRLEYF